MPLLRIFSFSLLLLMATASPAQGQAVAAAPLYDDTPSPEGGWKALANTLQALAPRVDTRLALSPSQVSERIQALLDSGEVDSAFDLINRRKAQRSAENPPGADVQLMFLEGRALALAGRHDEAIGLYSYMTQYYPELPEPWNNLASEYVRQGRLGMAEQALESALASQPAYANAHFNLGMVQLMRARASFEQAASLGEADAQTLLSATTQLLQN